MSTHVQVIPDPETALVGIASYVAEARTRHIVGAGADVDLLDVLRIVEDEARLVLANSGRSRRAARRAGLAPAAWRPPRVAGARPRITTSTIRDLLLDDDPAPHVGRMRVLDLLVLAPDLDRMDARRLLQRERVVGYTEIRALTQAARERVADALAAQGATS